MIRALGVAVAIVVLLAALINGVVAGIIGNNPGAAGCNTAVDALVPAPTPHLRKAGITPQRLRNAAIIVRVGQRKRIPRRGWIIAVATARQESSLDNLSGGDRDSVGLFQQRPSQGWGNREQLQDPVHASGLFYGALIKVPGWENLPLTVAAQRVQRSGYPDAYAKHEPVATAIVDLVGVDCTTPGGTARGQAVLKAAERWLGTPYVFGGGNAKGPTTGTEPGVGFDCSGLTLHAWAQVGVRLPHRATLQYQRGTAVPRGAEQPGDLVFFHAKGDPPGYYHHVGIYVSADKGGTMINAPHSGATVRYDRIWRSEYVGARRY